MSRRETLVAELACHRPADATEADHTARVAAFTQAHPDPFDRTIRSGHVTASALVASPELAQVLLVHHDALDRWLQPGGHAESTDPSGLALSLREAREESGLDVRPHRAWARLFDVDVHPIPASDTLPRHLHFDVRYLLVADPNDRPRPRDAGVREARWFDRKEAAEVGHGVGLARMLEKLDDLGIAALR